MTAISKIKGDNKCGMLIEQVYASFEKYAPLNALEKKDLGGRLHERTIKRRQFILADNDVCMHYTFVAVGCFRKYQVAKKKVEHNLQFTAENDWIMEIESFISGMPGRVYIEAIEPSIIFQLKRTDLLYLFDHNPKFDRMFRIVTDKKLVEFEKRLLMEISSSAQERYLFFAKEYPKLAARLSYAMIASYLGITPEFFSYLRKEMDK